MENLIDRVAGKRKQPIHAGKKRRDEDKAMQPVKHITDDSALGRAYKRVNQNSDGDTSNKESPSDSSSDPSESSESSDNDSSSSSSDANAYPKRRKHQKRAKGSKSAHRKQKSLLKPIPPEKYNGQQICKHSTNS